MVQLCIIHLIPEQFLNKYKILNLLLNSMFYYNVVTCLFLVLVLSPLLSSHWSLTCCVHMCSWCAFSPYFACLFKPCCFCFIAKSYHAFFFFFYFKSEFVQVFSKFSMFCDSWFLFLPVPWFKKYVLSQFIAACLFFGSALVLESLWTL